VLLTSFGQQSDQFLIDKASSQMTIVYTYRPGICVPIVIHMT
jgi:hypothetical protein